MSIRIRLRVSLVKKLLYIPRAIGKYSDNFLSNIFIFKLYNTDPEKHSKSLITSLRASVSNHKWRWFSIAAMPYGQLPVLEVDGWPIAQSNAIARHLARRHGLAGADEWEAMLCDVLVDSLGDLRQGESNLKYSCASIFALLFFAIDTTFKWVENFSSNAISQLWPTFET